MPIIPFLYFHIDVVSIGNVSSEIKNTREGFFMKNKAKLYFSMEFIAFTPLLYSSLLKKYISLPKQVYAEYTNM
jgi:hypothetical protein